MFKIITSWLISVIPAFKAKLYHKNVNSWFHESMVHSRIQKANRSYKHRNIILGDSIFHFGESIFNKYDIDNYAIGGETTSGILKYIEIIMYLTQPKSTLIHIGGNDDKAGISNEIKLNNLKQIYSICKKYCDNVAWLETVALGDANDFPKWPSNSEEKQKLYFINKIKIPEFIESVKKEKIPIIPIRKLLSKNGKIDDFILQKYGAGDLIHVNEKCYNEVYVPTLKNYFKI